MADRAVEDTPYTNLIEQRNVIVVGKWRYSDTAPGRHPANSNPTQLVASILKESGRPIIKGGESRNIG